MRKGREPQFVYTPVEIVKDKDGQRGKAKLLAINLGSDFCAEHEWGIKGIQSAFGISDDISVYGLKRRKTGEVPETLCWLGIADKGGLVFGSHWFCRTPESFFKDECEKGELAGKGLRTAWSEGDFAAASDDPGDIEKLQEIFQAFQKKNIIICWSKTISIQNPGLCLVIADRLPKETLEEWKQSDKEAHQLVKDVEATGIEKLLREKGRKYFALSPCRQPDGSIQYWLNPYEQDENNFGWYKLEDLQQWVEGVGPIPKPKKEVDARRRQREIDEKKRLVGRW